MIPNSISIKEVISKIVRDLGQTDQVPYQDYVEWIAEALQFIGGYEQYEVKTKTISIEDYTGTLPCDHYKPTYNKQYTDGLEYRLELGKIICNVRCCDIEYEYLAIPTDCDGYPKVPDDISYTTACRWYVMSMLALRGELNNKEFNYEYCRRQWDKYCGQARAQANMPSVDAMQRMTNQRFKLVPDMNQYYKLFRDLGKQELLDREKR
jgi:hypothetical protein